MHGKQKHLGCKSVNFFKENGRMTKGPIWEGG